MASNDWMPGKKENVLAKAKEWTTVLNEKAKEWEIPERTPAKLVELLQNAYELYLKTRGTVRDPKVTADCNNAFKALQAEMRDIKARYFRTPPLTDGDYFSLKLKPKDTIPTPVKAPTAHTGAEVKYIGKAVLEIVKIKPTGDPGDRRANYGVSIRYGILNATAAAHAIAQPPRNGDDLPAAVFTKRKNHRFDFPGETGKEVFFCLRYENAKGQAGPWSRMIEAIVPK
jgi:hypothetical protein